MNHTSPPWQSIAVYQSLMENGQKEYHIKNKDVHVGVINRLEDAEFVVGACNNFESLQEACRQAINALEDYVIKPLEEYERLDVIYFIKQALFKCKEQSE